MTRITIVCELGVNWGGSKAKMHAMMAEARDAGADAVKFQAFLPEHVKDHPQAEELLKSSLTPTSAEDAEAASKSLGIEWFCTAFYPEAVEWLEEFGVKRYKIRERDARALISPTGDASAMPPTPLIRRVMDTNKPVIMSVRRKPLDQHWLFHPRITWLYCLPAYPAALEDLELWKCSIGYGLSCHTPDPVVPVVAATMMSASDQLGEKVIELHTTLNRQWPDPDSAVSFDFIGLKQAVQGVRAVERLNLKPLRPSRQSGPIIPQ